MSSLEEPIDPESIGDPICEVCGTVIDEDHQKCPAQDGAECGP